MWWGFNGKMYDILRWKQIKKSGSVREFSACGGGGGGGSCDGSCGASWHGASCGCGGGGGAWIQEQQGWRRVQASSLYPFIEKNKRAQSFTPLHI